MSQTDTETVGGQSDVEGPVKPSWSEPEPINEWCFQRRIEGIEIEAAESSQSKSMKIALKVKDLLR